MKSTNLAKPLRFYNIFLLKLVYRPLIQFLTTCLLLKNEVGTILLHVHIVLCMRNVSGMGSSLFQKATITYHYPLRKWGWVWWNHMLELVQLICNVLLCKMDKPFFFTIFSCLFPPRFNQLRSFPLGLMHWRKRWDPPCFLTRSKSRHLEPQH